MGSAYPVIWAMKHAPVADAFERLILIAMADAADDDGCNSYRSMRSHMRIAKDVSKSTIVRRQADMAKRGLIRPDTTPAPQRYLDIPEYKRPPRWEVCIPCSWWSEAQLEEVNRRREDLGLELITPENRPDLPDAPEKPKRADKGVPAPKRGRKKKQSTRGVSETPPQEIEPESEGGCLRDTGGGVSETPGGGVSETPNLPLSDPPSVPSSPPAPPMPGNAGVPGATPEGREDDQDQDALQKRAVALVDAAVRRWPTRHKAPGVRDRLRLAGRIAGELANGGMEEVILHELTRDLRDAGSAISVVMGARTKVEGWGRPTDPRPDRSQYEIPSTAPWCGLCDERTRMVVIRDIDTGEERPGRCRRPVVDTFGAMVACNPNTTPMEQMPEPETADDGHGAVELDPAVLEQMQASLEAQAAEAQRRREAEVAATRRRLEEIRADAALAETARSATYTS